MISAPEAIISLTSIHRPLSGRLEAHATIKLTIDTQPSAEPTLGSTVNSLDNTVTLKGVVEAHQDIQVKVTVNDTDYTANATFTGTSPTETPVNKSSGVDEMISLSEATWHSVSVDEKSCLITKHHPARPLRRPAEKQSNIYCLLIITWRVNL